MVERGRERTNTREEKRERKETGKRNRINPYGKKNISTCVLKFTCFKNKLDILGHCALAKTLKTMPMFSSTPFDTYRSEMDTSDVQYVLRRAEEKGVCVKETRCSVGFCLFLDWQH